MINIHQAKLKRKHHKPEESYNFELAYPITTKILNLKYSKYLKCKNLEMLLLEHFLWIQSHTLKLTITTCKLNHVWLLIIEWLFKWKINFNCLSLICQCRIRVDILMAVLNWFLCQILMGSNTQYVTCINNCYLFVSSLI